MAIVVPPPTVVVTGVPPPTGTAVRVFVVRAAPLSVAAVHVTLISGALAVVSPADAKTFVGAAGTVAGVTGVEGVDGVDAPTTLTAVTVNEYAVPRVRPPTVVAVPAGDPVTTRPVQAAQDGVGETV